jgi:ribosomal protein S18 acetylase RimI-like enzyme
MLDPGVRLDDVALTRREIREAGDVAGRAFAEGPFFKFLFPNELERTRSVRIIHRTVVSHPGRGARIRTARDSENRIVGLSLWLPTGCYPLSSATQLAQLPGGLRSSRRLSSMRVGMAYAKATAPLHPTEPHWYLWLLMADPARQHHGIGTALMSDALASVDHESVGSYLETNNESNVAFYARFGFAVRATIRPLPGGPQFFSLWREPRRGLDNGA